MENRQGLSWGLMENDILHHSTKDGPLKVTLELVLAGYQIADDKKNAENVTKNDLTEVTDPSLQQLLEGHILLFAGYNEKAGCYKGWISQDAEYGA